MQKKQMTAIRIAMNAVMIGAYIALSYAAIMILGRWKITFEHFPVVLSAVMFGPADAVLVGGIGELINQFFTYGLTPTTALWVLPIVARGLMLGLCAKLWKRQVSSSAICSKAVPVIFMIVCVLSGIISSGLNTLALYVDSKMLGYYTYAMVFGALLVRIVLSCVTSVIMVIGTKAVLHALYKARLI